MVQSILHSPGLASYRRRPLISNVRPHTVPATSDHTLTQTPLRRAATALCICLIVSTANARAEEADRNESRWSPSHGLIGILRLGQTPAEIEARLGKPIALLASGLHRAGTSIAGDANLRALDVARLNAVKIDFVELMFAEHDQSLKLESVALGIACADAPTVASDLERGGATLLQTDGPYAKYHEPTKRFIVFLGHRAPCNLYVRARSANE